MNQPRITPGSNGYLPPAQQHNYQNPWQIDDVSGDMATGQANLQGLMGQYQAAAAPYPSFPNDAGVGSQTAFSAAPQSQGQYSAPASQSMGTPPVDNSRGFNPWSLQGEALAR